MLEEQNQIAYMSHNHPQAISLVRRFGEVSSRAHFNGVCEGPYQIEDTNVWGHLHPEHRYMSLTPYITNNQGEQTPLALAEVTPKPYWIHPAAIADSQQTPVVAGKR